jgi:hypothetical protein
MAELATYAIYEKPRDFPESFVVRRWTVRGGVLDPVADPEPLVVADSLEAARRGLEDVVPGLFRLSREPGDDSVIVETWI